VSVTEVTIEAVAGILLVSMAASVISRRAGGRVAELVAATLQTVFYVVFAAFLGWLAYAGDEPLAVRIAEGLVMLTAAIRAFLLAILSWRILTRDQGPAPSTLSG
jgi:hypothetical protein